MTTPDTFSVEVVFALPEKQRLIAVDAVAGMTAAEAIAASGILAQFEGYELQELRIGIWGREVEAGQRLSPGDRVELYRPLVVEPREARRLRAAKGPDSAPGRGESR